jgi:hypothetical protein
MCTNQEMGAKRLDADYRESIDNYQQDLKKCRTRLAGEMGLEDVPDEVWGYVEKLELVYDAIRHSDDSSWRELVEEAKDRWRESLEGTGSVLPPGRGQGKGAHAPSTEIRVEPSEQASKRAQAFSEMAAALAEKHPEIKSFRRRRLRNRLLTDDGAHTVLDRHDGPDGPSWIMRELRKLAARLAVTYRWREGDAIWFVLTGHAPLVRPLEVSVVVSQTSRYPGRPRTLIPGSSPKRYHAADPRTADYYPSTATITVTADVWVAAEEVERVFRETQRHILGGDARPADERTLEVVKFVARRMRERKGEREGKGETWEERWKAWNRTCPEEWRYDDYRGFRQTFKRFANRLHKPYVLPNIPVPEPTPYQAYRNDLIDRRAGER